MDYLFFDIECANCDDGMGKICTFGYVITDVHFKVLKKEDILIRPNAKFEAYVAKKILAYPVKQINASPDFIEKYEQIKALLEEEDRIIFGYNVKTDMGYLLSECFRYKKPLLRYKARDIQQIFQKHLGLEQPVSLDKALCLLDEDVEKISFHRSDEDAYASMIVLKKLVKDKGYVLLTGKEGEKDELSSTLSMAPKGILQKIATNYAKKKARPGELSGKIICIDEALANNKTENYLLLVMAIIDMGGEIYKGKGRCDIFLSFEEYRNKHAKQKQVRWDNLKDSGVKRVDYMDFASEWKIDFKAISMLKSEAVRSEFGG